MLTKTKISQRLFYGAQIKPNGGEWATWAKRARTRVALRRIPGTYRTFAPYNHAGDDSGASQLRRSGPWTTFKSRGTSVSRHRESEPAEWAHGALFFAQRFRGTPGVLWLESSES